MHVATSVAAIIRIGQTTSLDPGSPPCAIIYVSVLPNRTSHKGEILVRGYHTITL